MGVAGLIRPNHVPHSTESRINIRSAALIRWRLHAITWASAILELPVFVNGF